MLEEGETQRLGKSNLQLVRKKGFETPLCVLRWFHPCDPQESEPPIHLIHPRVMKVARDESTIALTNVRKTQCNEQSDEQGPTSFTRQTCVEAAQVELSIDSIPIFYYPTSTTRFLVKHQTLFSILRPAYTRNAEHLKQWTPSYQQNSHERLRKPLYTGLPMVWRSP